MCERLLANPVIEAYDGRDRRSWRRRERDASASSVFPGTNCELDVACARSSSSAARPSCCGTATTRSHGVDAVVVPGGFAHGDYLRTGAHRPLLAGDGRGRASSPPPAVRSSASATASRCSPKRGLLPGRAAEERGLKFLCETVELRVETTSTGAHQPARRSGDVLRIPINHFEGNYVCDAATLPSSAADDRIVVRYVDNPNGSLDDIAGICNDGRQRRRAHAAPRAAPRRAARLGRRRRAAAIAARRRDGRATLLV